MNIGKCPKCGKTVDAMDSEHVVIGGGLTPQLHGVSFLCPFCKTVLGAQIDPITLSEDTARKVVARMKKK